MNGSGMDIAFTKMNGLGNDFIVIDARETALTLRPEHIRQLAARENRDTKGCDQLLIMREPVGSATVLMEIYNADGSQVEACGNGTRAVAALLAQEHCTIETLGGVLACHVEKDGLVTVDMGQPRLAPSDIPVSDPNIDPRSVSLHEDLPPACLVSMGNPHAVIFVDGDPRQMAAHYGPELEHHALFPARANINFCVVHDAGHLQLATWERGAGLTKACGTGACATAVAHGLRHGFQPERFIQLDVPGGTLHIRVQGPKGNVWMRGPAETEFASIAHIAVEA